MTHKTTESAQVVAVCLIFPIVMDSSPVALSTRVAAVPVLGRAFSVVSNVFDQYGRHSDILFVRRSVVNVEARLQGPSKSSDDLCCLFVDLC